jgi:hypothetical protein
VPVSQTCLEAANEPKRHRARVRSPCIMVKEILSRNSVNAELEPVNWKELTRARAEFSDPARAGATSKNLPTRQLTPKHEVDPRIAFTPRVQLLPIAPPLGSERVSTAQFNAVGNWTHVRVLYDDREESLITAVP